MVELLKRTLYPWVVQQLFISFVGQCKRSDYGTASDCHYLIFSCGGVCVGCGFKNHKLNEWRPIIMKHFYVRRNVIVS